MTPEQIHSILDKMLEDSKAKNFLNHLVRAYTPSTNVEKVEVKPTGVFKCVITKEDLVCMDDILTGLETEEFKKNLDSFLKNMFIESGDKESPIKKMVGDKKLGVKGKNTNTFMSFPAYKEFKNWLAVKIVNGDKHINWLMNTIRRETRADKPQINYKKPTPSPKPDIKPATYTLGDLGVLQKLKDTLNNNDNKK